MSEAAKMIGKLDAKRREYLEGYFAKAPGWLMDSLQVVRLPKGTSFIKEGNKADCVYILVKGKVLALDCQVSEITYGFYDFEPVSVFGSMEILIDEEIFKTTLVTTKDSILLRISRSRFERWLKHDIEAFRAEVKSMGRSLVEQARKDRLYLLLSGLERVCLILSKLYEFHAVGGVFDNYISRESFAGMTGLSERTITRSLAELGKRGLITKNGWNIVITNRQYLMLKEIINDKIYKIGERK